MEPIIDHIEITVKDMSVVQYSHPRLGFAITSPRKAFAGDTIHRRKPGAIHPATTADSDGARGLR